MRLVIFAHPHFLPFYSIHRFTEMLAAGMAQRGHDVKIIRPKAQMRKLPLGNSLRSVLGHIDQYLLFAPTIKKVVRQASKDTLYIFTDNALGPWIPYIKNRPHVVHCHDFLAQQQAMNTDRTTAIKPSAALLQRFIRKGYLQASNFISVSQHTRQQLHTMIPHASKGFSEVVYNGFNRPMLRQPQQKARNELQSFFNIPLEAGFLLHVGSDAWYKNRQGLIDIYDQWRIRHGGQLPLLLVGAAPGAELRSRIDRSPFAADIFSLSTLTDATLELMYAGASLMLFPSIAEGFGWPIAEALACGCLVLTTGAPPMDEVGGPAAFYLAPLPLLATEQQAWAEHAANTVQQILSLDEAEKEQRAGMGIVHARRFATSTMLDQLEQHYTTVLHQYQDA